MILNSMDLPLVQPDVILLDAKSFLIRTDLKELIIPLKYQSLFEQISLQFNIISLFEPQPEASSFDKLKGVFKKQVVEEMPFFGEKHVLPLQGWKNLIKQYTCPVFYMGNPSSLNLYSIPEEDRLDMPPMFSLFQVRLSNYYHSKYEHDNKLKIMDPKKAHTTKMFSTGKPSTFGDKFNV